VKKFTAVQILKKKSELYEKYKFPTCDSFSTKEIRQSVPKRVSEAVPIKGNEIVENVLSGETSEHTTTDKRVPVVSKLLL
jgi:hypothetical protein